MDMAQWTLQKAAVIYKLLSLAFITLAKWWILVICIRIHVKINKDALDKFW